MHAEEKNISNTCVKVISTVTFVIIVSHVDLENNLETNSKDPHITYIILIWVNLWFLCFFNNGL